MIDYVEIITTFFYLVLMGILTYMTKLQKTAEDRKKLNEFVKVSVEAAEQLYKTGVIQDRKKVVMNGLAKRFDVSADELEKRVEAAVLNIPKTDESINTLSRIVPETELDGRGD